MVIVQRIVVRWSKRGRGAAEAARRGEVPAAFELPPLPEAPLAVHDLLAAEPAGYAPVATVAEQALPSQAGGLRFALEEGTVTVARAPVWASYPTRRHPAAVFRLRPGERARYLANFRYSGYGTDWYYEQWTINIACARWRHDLFTAPGAFDQEKDERVSLYGGAR